MITLTFREFVHQGEDIVDYGDGDFELYLLRDEYKILYIGIAEYGIFSRWFLNPGSHMARNLSPYSFVGHKIIDNLPSSAEWKIDFWAIKDLIEFLEIESRWDSDGNFYRIPNDFNGLLTKQCRVRHLEEFMIRYLCPEYNVIGNNFKCVNVYFTQKYLKLVS